jgi:CheY-like chemotaxis protein
VVGEDIEMIIDLDRETGLVMADPGQLHQVLLNLVVNARDAMPTGGGLTLRTFRRQLDQTAAASFPGANPGDYVVMEVCDTGVGISEEVQQKIFDPFFTTKPKGAGTGLGLSTVYGIVQQSGGWIGVESQPGMGATFRIGLPFRAQTGPQLRRDELPPVQLEGTETVLVVEDQEDVRKLVLAILQEYHYRTLEANSGSEAVEIVEGYDGPIHLMLTDLIMPGMTGKQTADRLSAVRREMKVLYMSGYTDDVISRRGMLDAGIDYIAKPFTPETLARKIRLVLERDVTNSVTRAGS